MRVGAGRGEASAPAWRVDSVNGGAVTGGRWLTAAELAQMRQALVEAWEGQGGAPSEAHATRYMAALALLRPAGDDQQAEIDILRARLGALEEIRAAAWRVTVANQPMLLGTPDDDLYRLLCVFDHDFPVARLAASEAKP